MHSMILELNCQEQHGSSPLKISYLNLAEFGCTGPYLENTCVFCFLWNNIELRPPINRKGRTVFVPIVSILNAIKDFSLKEKVRQRDSLKRLVSDLKGFLMTVAYNTAVALSIPCLFQNKLVFKCYSFIEGLVRHTLYLTEYREISKTFIFKPKLPFWGK